jgi:hypothetical protein
MRLRLSICTGLAMLAGGLVDTDVAAQTRGTTGQNGQGGSSSSMFGSGTGGTGGTSFGSSGVGTTGQGGIGQTGQGGVGQPQGGVGQNRNTTGFGNQNQNNGFLGINNNPNNFIGRNNQGQNGNLNGQTGNLGRGNNQGGNRRQLDPSLQQMLNGGNQGGGNGQTSQQPVIRPRQKVAFEYPQPKLDAIVTTTQTRLQKLSVRYPRLSDVQLAQEADGTIVLRGSAPTEADARVAESMIRLEPGVRKTRNELTFPPPRPENE